MVSLKGGLCGSPSWNKRPPFKPRLNPVVTLARPTTIGVASVRGWRLCGLGAVRASSSALCQTLAPGKLSQGGGDRVSPEVPRRASPGRRLPC